MNAFSQYKAFQKLRALQEHPLDLTQPEVFTEDRIDQMRISALGFDLLFGAQRITSEGMNLLYELAEESQALEKMRAMQEGEILNQINGVESENRAVLHTAMRDLFDHPQIAPVAREATHLASRELEKLDRFLNGIEKEKRFSTCIQVGIGGSDLGPRALYLAAQPFCRPDRKVYFISNLDPDDATSVLNRVDLTQTLVIVVSKSGSTLETLTNEERIRAEFRKKGLNANNHFVAVTAEKSPLDDPSRYLQSFYIWDFVGGRYSSTSMVGAVMLSFAMGLNGFYEILKGAHAMDLHAQSAAVQDNLPLHTALLGIWNRNFLQLPTVAVIPYSQALSRFSAHLQQLDMESNGKHIDKEGKVLDFSSGPIIWGEPGTNGQHSFYQWLHQGTDQAALELIGFCQSQFHKDLEVHQTSSQEKLIANLFAQSISLAIGQKHMNPNKVFKGNRPNSLLLAKRLDLFTLGALLAYYEHKVAFQGFIWNINSFDQEGVQLGKVLSEKILTLLRAPHSRESIPSFPIADAYLRIYQKRSKS